MGARGNSGVILSQIVRGAAEVLTTRRGDLIGPALVRDAPRRGVRRRLDVGRRPAGGDDADGDPRGPRGGRRRASPRWRRPSLGPAVDDAAQDAMLARADGDRDHRRPDGAGAHARAARGPRRGRGRRRRRLRADRDPRPGSSSASAARRRATRRSRTRRPPTSRAGSTPARATSTAPAASSPGPSSTRARSCRGWRSWATRSPSSATRRCSRSTSTPTTATGCAPICEEYGDVDQFEATDMHAQIAARHSRDGLAVTARRHGDAQHRGRRRRLRLRADPAVRGRGRQRGRRRQHPQPLDRGDPRRDPLGSGRGGHRPAELPQRRHGRDRGGEARRATGPRRLVDGAAGGSGGAGRGLRRQRRRAAENAERLEAELQAIATGLVAEADRDDADGRYSRGDAVGFCDGELIAWGDPADDAGGGRRRLRRRRDRDRDRGCARRRSAPPSWTLAPPTASRSRSWTGASPPTGG